MFADKENSKQVTFPGRPRAVSMSSFTWSPNSPCSLIDVWAQKRAPAGADLQLVLGSNSQRCMEPINDCLRLNDAGTCSAIVVIHYSVRNCSPSGPGRSPPRLFSGSPRSFISQHRDSVAFRIASGQMFSSAN